VEMVNLRVRRVAPPVHLREPYAWADCHPPVHTNWV